MEKQMPVFEYVTCSRCCGTGKYSFNLMHGDRCYGCSGKGYKLTARGAAACKFYSDSMCKPAKELQVGDVVRVEGMTNGLNIFYYFAKITKIVPTHEVLGYRVNDQEVRYMVMEYKTESEKYGIQNNQCNEDAMIRVAHSGEDKRILQAKALEYQAKLTKSGKLMKKFGG